MGGLYHMWSYCKNSGEDPKTFYKISLVSEMPLLN